MGLVSQTRPTDSGTLHRKTNAKTAAATICSGIGIQAQNSPFKKASATDRRFRCQRSSANSCRPTQPHRRMCAICSGGGMILETNFFGMTFLSMSDIWVSQGLTQMNDFFSMLQA